jgi:hypothetical protein
LLLKNSGAAQCATMVLRTKLGCAVGGIAV